MRGLGGFGDVRNQIAARAKTSVACRLVRRTLRQRTAVDDEAARGTKRRRHGFRERQPLPRVVAERDEIDGLVEAAQRIEDSGLGDLVPVELLAAGLGGGEWSRISFADPVNPVARGEPCPRERRVGHEGVDRHLVVEDQDPEMAVEMA